MVRDSARGGRSAFVWPLLFYRLRLRGTASIPVVTLADLGLVVRLLSVSLRWFVGFKGFWGFWSLLVEVVPVVAFFGEFSPDLSILSSPGGAVLRWSRFWFVGGRWVSS
ncbi:hypothetical protein ISN44_As09g024420 [Arabidopsis suecica]|uniref:Uncharacterized protein n=1 Tax=Arabidopsis suecica TaxID=45249 RepID=A0A8T2ANK8_ARASU|nr:hypothetical protein ISN44_As09g024420 [Arabidopsis suecica]